MGLLEKFHVELRLIQMTSPIHVGLRQPVDLHVRTTRLKGVASAPRHWTQGEANVTRVCWEEFLNGGARAEQRSSNLPAGAALAELLLGAARCSSSCALLAGVGVGGCSGWKCDV